MVRTSPDRDLVRLVLGPLVLLAPFALPALGARADVVAVDPAKPLASATAIETGATIEPALDLDLGYRDFVDLELAVDARAPQSATVTLRFSTDGPPPPGADRAHRTEHAYRHAHRVDPSALVRDGELHTYRLDLGLVLPWCGDLERLAVDCDRQVRCTSIAVGDRPGDVYVARPTVQNPAAGEKNELGEAVEVAESKHFRLLWSPRSLELGFDPGAQVHGTLRNLEEAWQVLVKDMGLNPPHESWQETWRDGTRSKVNVSTWFEGYWAGGEQGDFGRLNVTGDGLRVDPPSWVVPHELCHVFQMHQEEALRGDWWESHADYAIERWLARFAPLHEQAPLSAFNPEFAATAHYTTPWGGHYYLCWPLWSFLDENPDGLDGLGSGTSARLWREASGEHGEVWERIGELTATSRADLCGLWARRNVLWDYANRAGMRAAVDEALADEVRRRMIHTPLVPSEGRDDRWRPPFEKLPQQFAYAVHPLEPDDGARLVEVELEPLPCFDREESLRASLVVEAADGSTRVGELFARGRSSIAWQKDDRACYLVVAATPREYLFVTHDDLARPYGDDPARRRFAYEVRVENARPADAPRAAFDPEHMRPHPHGGGLVARSAHVAETAWVGPDALVLDRARVEGRARIEGRAVVRDDAVVADSAIVSDLALVRERARIAGRARVRDMAVVEGHDTVVDGRAQVRHHARVRGGAHVTDAAIVRGCAIVFDGGEDARIAGHAIVEGDAHIGRTATTGAHTGFQPWSIMPPEWIAARTTPEGLVAAWTFDAAASFGAPDAGGALDAVVRDGARIEQTDGRGALVLERDGGCAVLDPSVLDLEGAWTIHAVARAAHDASALLAARAGDERSLRLDLRGDRGRPAYEIRAGSESLRLVGREPVPEGTWVELTVVCADGAIELRVDGEVVDTAEATLEPAALYGGDARDEVEILLGAEPHRRARFEGAIDELRILRR